jgi:hypothetical protein
MQPQEESPVAFAFSPQRKSIAPQRLARRRIGFFRAVFPLEIILLLWWAYADSKAVV